MKTEYREALKGIELMVGQLMVMRKAVEEQGDISPPELALACEAVGTVGLTLVATVAQLEQDLQSEPPLVRDSVRTRSDALVARADTVGAELKDILFAESAKLGVPTGMVPVADTTEM